MDVGTELRQAREQRGLSLHELAERTKISLTVLRALENNDVARIPGGVFTRGFLTAYAREVGLDPADITQRYTAQSEPSPPPAEDRESRRDLRPATHRLLSPVRVFSAVTALIVVAATYVAVARWHGSAPPGPSESPPASTSVHAADDRSSPSVGRIETAATGSSDAPASPAATSRTVLRIELQPRNQCWISATADGNRVAYRLMQAEDRLTIDVYKELVLRIGDPANLSLSINGSPASLSARSGTPITVRLTPQNYRAFLAQ